MNPIKQLSREELIAREAKSLATSLIERELDRHNFPLPKDSALDFHITALLKAKPELFDLARARVEAKQDAYTESLLALGIKTIENAKPLELEI